MLGGRVTLFSCTDWYFSPRIFQARTFKGNTRCTQSFLAKAHACILWSWSSWCPFSEQSPCWESSFPGDTNGIPIRKNLKQSQKTWMKFLRNLQKNRYNTGWKISTSIQKGHLLRRSHPTGQARKASNPRKWWASRTWFPLKSAHGPT